MAYTVIHCFAAWSGSLYFASIAFLHCYRNYRDYWVGVVLGRTTFSATESKILFQNLKTMKVNFLLCYVRNLIIPERWGGGMEGELG